MGLTWLLNRKSSTQKATPTSSPSSEEHTTRPLPRPRESRQTSKDQSSTLLHPQRPWRALLLRPPKKLRLTRDKRGQRGRVRKRVTKARLPWTRTRATSPWKIRRTRSNCAHDRGMAASVAMAWLILQYTYDNDNNDGAICLHDDQIGPN